VQGGVKGSTAKISDACAMHVEREKVDAAGENAMFGDDDMKQAQMLLFDFLHDFYCMCNFYCSHNFNCVCYFCCVCNIALTLSWSSLEWMWSSLNSQQPKESSEPGLKIGR